MEMRSCEIAEVLRDPLVNDSSTPPAYTARLLSHIVRFREKLDDLIRIKAEKWEFHRIAMMDKLILRMGAAELLYFPDVPPKVSINEAIEIAKEYSTDNSGKFVNGILDSIHKDIKAGRITAAGEMPLKTKP